MEDSSLRILYSDESLICCVKQPGILSESTGMPALISRVTGAGEVFPVHRLDRDTGGVMVYALTGKTAAALSQQFAPSGSARKTYLAVLEGVPEKKEGTLSDLLFYDRHQGRSYVVDRMRKGVREASLDYRILSGKEGVSLAVIGLHSGRTHQIRVQFSHIGCPVLGDRRYGSGTRCPLALWACSLTFSHPDNGQEMTVSCAPPEVFPWDLFPAQTRDVTGILPELQNS